MAGIKGGEGGRERGWRSVPRLRALVDVSRLDAQPRCRPSLQNTRSPLPPSPDQRCGSPRRATRPLPGPCCESRGRGAAMRNAAAAGVLLPPTSTRRSAARAAAASSQRFERQLPPPLPPPPCSSPSAVQGRGKVGVAVAHACWWITWGTGHTRSFPGKKRRGAVVAIYRMLAALVKRAWPGPATAPWHSAPLSLMECRPPCEYFGGRLPSVWETGREES